MTRVLFPAFLLLWLGCTAPERESPTQGNFTLLASESLAPLIEQEAAEFHRIYPSVHAVVIPAPTREAIVTLFNDTISAIATDRPLNGEERSIMTQAQLPIMETTIGEDALVVLVNEKNGIQWLSFPDLERILSGATTTWGQISQSGRSGALHLSLTGRNSGVYELLERHFFRLGKGINVLNPAPSQKSVIDEVAKNPSTIGITSFSAFKSIVGASTTGVRPLQIVGPSDSNKEGVGPSQQAIYSKTYPLTYPLFLYVKEEKAGPASGFASFLTSQQGQKIIQNAGILPVKIPSRPIQLVQEQ